MYMPFLNIAEVMKSSTSDTMLSINFFHQRVSVVNAHMMPHAYVKTFLVKIETYIDLFGIYKKAS